MATLEEAIAKQQLLKGVAHLSPWSEWVHKIVVIPKQSISGERIWGRVYHRQTLNAWRRVLLSKHHPDWREQWGSKKDIFLNNLQGDNNV